MNSLNMTDISSDKSSENSLFKSVCPKKPTTNAGKFCCNMHASVRPVWEFSVKNIWVIKTLNCSNTYKNMFRMIADNGLCLADELEDQVKEQKVSNL